MVVVRKEASVAVAAVVVNCFRFVSFLQDEALNQLTSKIVFV